MHVGGCVDPLVQRDRTDTVRGYGVRVDWPGCACLPPGLALAPWPTRSTVGVAQVITRVTLFIVMVGAVKALLPTPGHVMEWGEIGFSAVIVSAYYVWRAVLAHGEETKQAPSGD